ncbi:MAG: aminotransferase class I/II-fold pyridoxal phosphate-dependent enzyme, partial [Pseudomonadota bacterium]|nr:aminotransferase class I/II-fold pyridoxal phosphate-dependent enzyme [Pseudomonadota bacterium]
MSIEQRIAAIRSTALGSMSAYHVQPAQNVIKLDAMENPFHWPKALEAKWQESLAGIAMNRYPSAGAESLKEQLRRVFSIDSAYPIVLGNGSDELILLLAQIVHQPGACIMGVDPSFVMYRQITHSLNLDYIGIALNDDFSIDLPKTLAAIEQHKPSLIFLAMPNNPTGNLFSDQDVQAIIEAAPGLVVLDEAYTAFTQYDSQKWLV